MDVAAEEITPPLTLEIFGKNSIYFGTNLTEFLVDDLVKNAVPNVRVIVIVTDTNVGKIHLPELLAMFGKIKQVQIGRSAKELSSSTNRTKSKDCTKLILNYVIPPGEGSKSREMVARIEDFLLEEGCNRDTCLVALGGGVIGDLVGFVASTYLRGIPLVQIPTSLLAMADSAIGGKNGIDTPAGKNLIGTTYEPIRIYVDLKYLATLPPRELSNGMAEVIKTCAISSNEEFTSLEESIENFAQFFKNGKWNDAVQQQKLSDIILSSIKFKAAVVTVDKHDSGRRHLLNFGHTVGHALESLYAPYLLHGEAVSIGMVLEQEIAVSLRLGQASDVERLINVLAKVNLPTSVLEGEVIVSSQGKLFPATPDTIVQKMKIDKKNSSQQICMSLLIGFGVPMADGSIPISEFELATCLERLFQR